LSVDADHERLIWLVEAVDAARFVGLEGALVSAVWFWVVAPATLEYPDRFPAASVARTR
jgi:hypothetical protein